MNRGRRIRRWLVVLAWLYVSYLLVSLLFFSLNPIDATRYFPIVWRRGISPMLTQLIFVSLFMVMQIVVLFGYMSRGRTYTIYPREYA